MRIKNNNSFISLLLVICMLLSGMCFERFETDSFFSYKYSKDTSSVLNSDSDVSTSSKILVEEPLGQRDAITSSRQSRHSEERTGARTDLYLSFLEILPLNPALIFSSIADNLYNEIISNTVIINYIHQKDGKKA